MARMKLRGSVDGRPALVEHFPDRHCSRVTWGGELRPDGPGSRSVEVEGTTPAEVAFRAAGDGLETLSAGRRLTRPAPPRPTPELARRTEPSADSHAPPRPSRRWYVAAAFFAAKYFAVVAVVVSVLAWLKVTSAAAGAGLVPVSAPSTAGATWAISLVLVVLLASSLLALRGVEFDSTSEGIDERDLIEALVHGGQFYAATRTAGWFGRVVALIVLLTNSWDLAVRHLTPRWGWVGAAVLLLLASSVVTKHSRLKSAFFVQVPYTTVTGRIRVGVGQGLALGADAAAGLLVVWFFLALAPLVRPARRLAWTLPFGLGHAYGSAVAALDSRPLTFLATLAVPVAVLGLLREVALRMSVTLTTERVPDPGNPAVLYLRSFDEDATRIVRNSSRRGLVESLLPPWRTRFESVLARIVAMSAPLDAVAPPHARRLLPGASRMHFADDEWQQGVAEAGRRALFVLLAATPEGIRDGLTWEIEHVGDHLDHSRIVLVVAPRPSEQLADRLQAFLVAATPYPSFASLSDRELPAGVCFLARSSTSDWKVYGSPLRTDVAYAHLMRLVIRDFYPEWMDELRIDPDVVSVRAQIAVLQGAGVPVSFAGVIAALSKFGILK